MNYNKLALELHEQFKGKIEIALRDRENLSVEKLSAYYTPGVGAVSLEVAAHPEELGRYTWINNLVAVVSNGSAVLGLGNIGPKGALPVMEGKALLFKYFADVDAVPIVINAQTPDEIVDCVCAIAPSFGAINLEDIAAPQCFEVENRLKAELDIPVMHDDQHGTAVVVLAGLINAMKVCHKDLNACRAVFSGVGAAGVAIMRLLKNYAPGLTLMAVDSRGLISTHRRNLSEAKQALLDDGIIDGTHEGTLSAALVGADIFVGVSQPNIVSSEDVAHMNDQAIVFALSNPDPEILPEAAYAGGAAVVATGRSDFPNQVNNALAFPGIFRGALDHGVKMITDEHKKAAAEALAALVTEPCAEEIIPSVFTPGLVAAVAQAIT